MQSLFCSHPEVRQASEERGLQESLHLRRGGSGGRVGLESLAGRARRGNVFHLAAVFFSAERKYCSSWNITLHAAGTIHLESKTYCLICCCTWQGQLHQSRRPRNPQEALTRVVVCLCCSMRCTGMACVRPDDHVRLEHTACGRPNRILTQNTSRRR